MRISTPTLADGPIEKEITVGGSVRFRLTGYRYRLESTVLGIDEENKTLQVSIAGTVTVIPLSAVLDVLTLTQTQLADFLASEPQQRH